MTKTNEKLFVISLGGSLIHPEEIDAHFLTNFKKLILKQIQKGHRFILITGGGKICRKYQTTLNLVSKTTDQNLDWMGIYATRLNAQLVRLIFGKLAHPQIVEDPNILVNFKEKILVAGGWMPGRSTDDDAVRLAKIYKSKLVINLSNIDHLYTKDPKKFKDAKKITKISWDGLLKITGKKWTPGANLPFDPTAAKMAKQENISVIISNGKNLKNLEKILNREPFQGTTIQAK
jgi:uridylate kinase